jgi:NitT/TauT family transport system substrate-binding protein
MKTTAALLARLAYAALGLALAPPGFAQDLPRLVFLTNWLAQAEHGGFYQAVAEGTYRKHGLDVEVKMGGPQVNVVQLLLGGQADLVMGYDVQTIKLLEQGLPVVTVGATFQKDPAVLIAHPDVKSLADLKTRTLLIGQASETTFWPWLKARYGFTDSQKRPYAFSVQQFLVDRNVAQQGYATSEPYSIEKGGVKPVVFLLADAGYPPYAQTIVTTRKVLQDKPDQVRRFLQATAEGWRSYLKNPQLGNALIKHANPQMEDELMAYGLRKMQEFALVTGGDAQKQGILAMADARWKQTFDFMVSAGLVKPDVDYRKAYTLELLKGVRVLP